jgi:WD40 repeat protein
MMNRFAARKGLAFLVVLLLAMSATTAWAVTPTVVWQKAGLKTGPSTHAFSVDGTVLLVNTSAGFELRRTSDGALLNTVTLPAASLTYKDAALSPDKQLIALVLDNRSIELWRVSNSTVARTISTDAVRDIKWVGLSNTFVATIERFAYGGGGMLRVHNVATGALVKTALAIHNSSPAMVKFSPNGQYLSYPDHYAVSGFVVLRTSDWATALTVPGTTTFAWSPDGGSLWTDDYRRVRVPDGAVLQTVPPHPDTVVEAYTPDNQFFLADVFANFQFTNVLQFLRTSDASVRVTYTFPGVTAVYGGRIDSTGKFFTYSTCSTECTVYVARVPAL